METSDNILTPATVAAGVTASSSSGGGGGGSLTDPFRYISQHLHRRVAIALVPLHASRENDGGAVVRGTLLSVDDLCNVLVADWACSDAVKPAESGAAGGHPSPQPRKKPKAETFGGGGAEGEESVRLIRGTHIVSISLLP